MSSVPEDEDKDHFHKIRFYHCLKKENEWQRADKNKANFK